MDEQDKKRLITTTGTRGNVRYITITDNQQEHWDDIINIAKSQYTWYAYIYHDKDETDKHLHILCYDKGGTSLKGHCGRFEGVIPSHFVCKVYNPRAMARYLIHKDNSDKFQYNPDEVITSSKDKYYNFLLDENKDVVTEYSDYLSLITGKITLTEFLEKYRGEFSHMPFFQKISLFSKLRSDTSEFNLNNNNNKRR